MGHGWPSECVPPNHPPLHLAAADANDAPFYSRVRARAPSDYNSTEVAACQQPGNPLFQCHRPATAPGMAAPLMHPVFGFFLDNMRNYQLPNQRDAQFAQQFCTLATNFYENEKQRQDVMVSGPTCV